MSYVSGFMLGASIGKAIHGMFCKKAAAAGPRPTEVKQPQPVPPVTPAFTCVSALKGRRRFRAAGLVQNHQLAALLEQKISRLASIESFQVNVLTGSILICSSNEQVLDAFEAFFRTRLFPGAGQLILRDLHEAQASEGKAKTVYTNTLYDIADMFSNFISKKTRHVLDLRSLVSLLFIIRGLRKMVMMGQRPTGPQMLWWAASLMRGLR